MRPIRLITIGLIGALIVTAGVLAQTSNAHGAAGAARGKPKAASSKQAKKMVDYTLRLGEQSFDLAQGLPMNDMVVGGQRSRPDVDDMRLVQFDGPTQQGWLDALEAQGLEVVQYIHPYTYITWGRVNNRADLEALPFVRATGDFAPAFRVQPRYLNERDDVLKVRALMYRGAQTDAVIRSIAGLGGQSTGRRVLNDTWEIATFDLPNAKMMDAASIPGVYAIHLEPKDGGLRGEMSDQVCADNVSGSNAAFPGYMSWLNTIGLDGSGVIIANVDGGIQDTHADLVGRMVSCSGSTCGGGTSSGHGTHTAGIMAGDGASGTLDGLGFLRGLGIAPGANLVEQLYSPTYTQSGGMLEIMKQSYANGALLSGNSWGPSGSPLGYDDDTMQVDLGVRDTNNTLAGDQPLTFVLSFMNGYGGTSSQGTPDEAKNIFNIGSTKMQNDPSGSQILDIDDLSSNSAHGPALDGRTIPHMVAPGCSVESTYTGGYDLLCGTSMASPHGKRRKMSTELSMCQLDAICHSISVGRRSPTQAA